MAATRGAVWPANVIAEYRSGNRSVSFVSPPPAPPFARAPTLRSQGGAILAPDRRPATHMPSNGRILIVEDDPAVREMLAEYLGTHGYEVAQADRGTAMREAVERSLPDLVLLDVNLPGEDGLT